MNRPQFEVGQIIRDFGKEFFDTHSVVGQVKKAFAAMAACRTAKLGGHVEMCPECGEIRISYNSCRDRHCPKCQNKDREVWIDARREEIITGVKYFHVVFTVPHCLNPLAMSHQALFYSCLFRAAWKTLEKCFKQQNLKGGMTAILHTWGSNLQYHPHIHCIVPGGGIDDNGIWQELDGCRGNRRFLFPVRSLSLIFRAKFMALLTGSLTEDGETIPQDVRKKAFEKDWNIESRPPARGIDLVLEYIGRYAFRVAISNSRILNCTDDGMVTFDWKDYKNEGVYKTATMHAIDFLHLLSLHILPKAFVRIRHYGLLSPSNRDKLGSVQVQMGGTPVPSKRKKKSYLQICELKGWLIGICPTCGCRMIVTETLPASKSPPKTYYDSDFKPDSSFDTAI